MSITHAQLYISWPKDVVKENGMMVQDGLTDLKRININILDLANGTQDR